MGRPEAEVARSVLSRAISVVDAFNRPPAARLALTDIAQRTGLPLTTVHRLCGQLLAEGVLERMSDGDYRVGLRLWELGSLAPRAQGLREVALPYLEDLYEAVHANVQLTVLDGAEVVVVERISAHDAVRLLGRAGGRLPVHAASSGLVLLAYRDREEQEAVLASPLRRITDATPVDPARVRDLLATARQQGFLVLENALTAGSTSLAAPVFGRGRSPVAAVSVVIDGGQDAAAVVPAILTVARGIGRALGRPA